MKNAKKGIVRLLMVVSVLLCLFILVEIFMYSAVNTLPALHEDVAEQEQSYFESHEPKPMTLAVDAGSKEKPSKPLTLSNHLLEAEAYRELASSGDIVAQYELGEVYRSSAVVPKDSRSMYWYRMSAEEGYGPAIFRLAEIYGETSSHRSLIYALYALALQRDASLYEAGDALQELKKQMTQQEIHAANALCIELQNKKQFIAVLDNALMQNQ